MYSLVQTSEPASEPITLAQAKAWLRFDGTNEDVVITDLIQASRIWAEKVTRRALVTQTFELALDAFPGCLRHARAGLLREPAYFDRRSHFDSRREIQIPRPPLVSVESVKYYDPDGTLQTFSTSSYFVDARTQPGRIVLNSNFDWPDTQVRPNAVVIAFTAGYGVASKIPQPVRVAIRQMISHWFENRGPVETGLRAAAVEIPQTAEDLLQTERIPEIY